MTVTDLTPDEPVDVAHVPGGEQVGDDELVPTVEFRGERFAVREHMSLLPMMKFAVIAKRQRSRQRDPAAQAQQGQEDMEALAALYELLQQCIAEDEFDRFYEHALSVGADQNDLMGVVRDSVAARSGGRPTRQPPASQDGRSTTAPSSAGGSSSQAWSTPQGAVDVQRDLELRGRPDMALVVLRAREASTSTSSG